MHITFMASDDAFGLRLYGLARLPMAIAVFFQYPVVLPMTLALTLCGIGSTYLLRLGSSTDSIAAGMAVIMSIAGFFLTYSIAQEMIYARTATILSHERVTSCASIGARMRSPAATMLVRRALLGRINASISIQAFKEGSDATQRMIAAVRTDDADKTSTDSQRAPKTLFCKEDCAGFDKVLDILALLDASAVSGTTSWCTNALMNIIVITVMLPLSVGLYTTMGRAFVIPQMFITILVLGSYDVSIDANNPFHPRFQDVIRRMERLVDLYCPEPGLTPSRAET